VERSSRLSGPQARVAASDILAAVELSIGESARDRREPAQSDGERIARLEQAQPGGERNAKLEQAQPDGERIARLEPARPDGERNARLEPARPGGWRVGRLEQAILSIDRLAYRADDEIDRLSVLRMKESLRLLAGPDRTGDGGVLPGLAAWDGTVLLDEVHVTGPLKEMYDQPGLRRSPETLRRYRFALSEMFHQQSHLLAADGRSYGDSAAAFTDPAVRLLEVGVTAAWTARHLDGYLEALGIPEIAPGIEQVRLPDGYPSYLPAAEALSAAIGQRVGLPADEVLRRLNAVTPTGKWLEMTTLLLNASGLVAVVPPAHRPAVARRVDQAMRIPLRAMATLRVAEGDEPGLQATSSAAGLASVDAAVTTIETIRREYTAR
jgi:hypothetical protein